MLLLCGMAKKTIKDCFKTVEVFTEDLPDRAIDAPVIVHTIEPPPNKHGAKAGIQCAEHVPQSGRLSGLPSG